MRVQVIDGKLYSVSDDGTMRVWRLGATPLQQQQQQQLANKDIRPLSCPSHVETTSSSPMPSTDDVQPHRQTRPTTVSCV